MASAHAADSDIRAVPYASLAPALAAVNGKRPKRKNNDPGPSNREKSQRARQLQQTFAKVSGKQAWPAGEQCCSKNCYQTLDLTAEQLVMKRESLHGLPDQAARRSYFRNLLLAVAPTHSMAQRLLNPPPTPGPASSPAAGTVVTTVTVTIKTAVPLAL